MQETYLADLFKVLKKYLWLITLLGIIGGVIGRMMPSDVPPPTYEASSLVLITPDIKGTNVFINQTDESTRFINSAQILANSSAIISVVKKELQLEADIKVLEGKVTVTNENGSYILRISVSDIDPTQAVTLANKIADVLQREVGNYLDVKLANVVEKAEKGIETQNVQPRYNANMIMGAIIGLVIGVFLSFILSYFFKPSKA